MRIVWTTGLVEPDDKWMMVTLLDTFTFEGGGQKSFNRTDPEISQKLSSFKVTHPLRNLKIAKNPALLGVEGEQFH